MPTAIAPATQTGTRTTGDARRRRPDTHSKPPAGRDWIGFQAFATYAERAEVVDWYLTLRTATDTLRDVLIDEPDWRGLMSVLKVDFDRETARVVLV